MVQQEALPWRNQGFMMNLEFFLWFYYGGEKRSKVVTREKPRNSGGPVCFSLCFGDTSLK